MASPRAPRQRLPPLIAWVGLAVCVSAVFVQATRTGVDILALLVAAFVLLLLERTLGDWIADTLGAGPAALIFAAIALAGILYVTSGSGRGRAARLFAEAQARGYQTAYFSVSESGKAAGVPAFHVTPPGAAATGGLPPDPTPLGAAPPQDAGSAAAAPAPPPPRPPLALAPDPRPPASGVRITQVRPSVDVATVGQAIALHADVTAEDDGELPAIEFSIDGRVVATARPAGGRATATWSTRVPGQYVVRARLPGRYPGGTSLSALITVLPGRVPQARHRTD